MTQQQTRTPTRSGAGRAMTAIRQDEYGVDPERVLRLGTAAVPEPKAGEVLVRVGAASIDRGTAHLQAGLPYPVRLAGFGVRRPNFGNPGFSLAGTVSAVGDGVDAFAPGGEVFGIGRAAFAEYAVAPAAKLALRPQTLTLAEAAALPVSGLTALQAVRDHGRVRPGERVLVYGASGGVGSLAVQLAVAAGARVTAVCSARKADRVAPLGADTVFAHEDGEPAGPFDVILDTGGNRPLRALRRLLTRTGRLVIIGGENGGRWLGGTGRQLRAQAMSPFLKQSLGTFISRENGADIAELGRRATVGEARPLLDSVVPLAETATAIRKLLDGDAVGKIVISIG